MVEGFQLRLAMLAVVVFLISGWYSFQEMRYAVWGRTVEGTVTQVEHRQERVYRRRWGSRTRHFTAVTVQFLGVDNTVQSGEFRESGAHAIRPQQQLKVQYIPGDYHMVRLSGEQNWFAIIFFFGGLIAMVGTIVWVGMEANRPYASSRIANSDRPVRAIVPKKKKRVLKPLKPAEEE